MVATPAQANELEPLVIRLLGDSVKFNQEVNMAVDTVNRAATETKGAADKIEDTWSQTLNRLGTKIQTFGQRARRIGFWMSAGITAPLKIMELMALRSAGTFEQTMISFETMLGGAREAQKLLGDLTRFAALTPFEMPEILMAARGLVQFGERGKELMETLNILGNAASGTSTNFGMLALIFNQVRGVGRLLTQDFRQLSTRGVISLQDIADHFGVTTAAAQKMMSEGKISFEDLRTILKKLSEDGGRFANLMVRQSESLLGKWSTLKDAFDITLRQIGQELAPAAKRLVSVLLAVTEAVAQSSSTTKRYVGVFAGLLAAIGPVLLMLGTLSFSVLNAAALIKSLTYTVTHLTISIRGTNLAIKGTTAAIYGLAAAGLLAFLAAARIQLARLHEEFLKTQQTIDRMSADKWKHIKDMISPMQQDRAILEERRKLLAEWRDAAAQLRKEESRGIRETGPLAGALEYFGVTDRMGQYRAEVEATERRLREFQKMVDEIYAGRKKTPFAGVPEYTPQQSQQMQDEKAIKGMTNNLRDQVMALRMGADAYELYKLAAAGATQGQIAFIQGLQRERDALRKAEQDKQRGRQLIEQFMTPQERFQKKMVELKRLYEAGALGQGRAGWEQYQRGIKNYKKELEALTEQPHRVKVDFAVQGLRAVRAGSAEAQLRLAQHRTMLQERAAALRGEGQFGGMEQKLARLVELGEADLDRPVFELAPADFIG